MITFRLKKAGVFPWIFTVLLSCSFPSVARPNLDILPDIGTTAGNTLSINQELALGDFYLRQLRFSAPMLNDPLLIEYVNQIGTRLVSHAQSVRTPFHFYLLDDENINAFAFFGGNIVIHTGLFLSTDNESQLASVLAHEISHVTQRHLARAIAERQRNSPLTWAGAVGSALLALMNPSAGMAALTGTLAGTQQSILSFTQQNEQEADRIGIQVLRYAGFDPQAMPGFLQKLADRARYSSTPPEMLLTHPLPASRLSDTRNRANQMKPNPVSSSLEYLLAKVRILGMYQKQRDERQQQAKEILNKMEQGNQREQIAAQYGLAILLSQQSKFDEAKRILQPLLEQQPYNVWFIDLITDIDIEQSNAPAAVARLEKAIEKKRDQSVLQINLANAYIKTKAYNKAIRLLYRYTYHHPYDPNGWNLLAQACGEQGLRDEELSARAESVALQGQWDQAIQLLSNASALVPIGSLPQARYDARIDQLRQLQQNTKSY